MAARDGPPAAASPPSTARPTAPSPRNSALHDKTPTSEVAALQSQIATLLEANEHLERQVARLMGGAAANKADTATDAAGASAADAAAAAADAAAAPAPSAAGGADVSARWANEMRSAAPGRVNELKVFATARRRHTGQQLSAPLDKAPPEPPSDAASARQKTEEEQARILAALKTRAPFDSLEETQQRLLVDAMTACDAKAGDVLVREGEEGNSCYLLDSGELLVREGSVEKGRMQARTTRFPLLPPRVRGSSSGAGPCALTLHGVRRVLFAGGHAVR
jgi:hypothetical protein